MEGILQQLQTSRDNRTEFGQTWTQGRSAFGGLSAAMALTGMRKLLPEEIPLRALLVSFVAPIPPGEVQVSARCLRQGKNVIQMQADVLVGEQIGLQAMGIFGKSRKALSIPAQRTAAPESREKGKHFLDHAERLPAFLRQFDGFWVSQGLPFSGTASNQLDLWCRHLSDLSAFPAEKLIAIADIPPPVILSYYDQPPVPASSLSWSLEFVKAPETIESDWFYLEFIAESAAEGYTQQSGRIYQEDGELCALSRQCMVYFD